MNFFANDGSIIIMKTNPHYRKPVICVLMAFCTLSLSARKVEFAYADMDQFRDFSLQGMSAERTMPIFERELQQEMDGFAERYLAEGQLLKITFLDIDMAGEIQPWRNTRAADIRYIEEIYPPRLKIAYELHNAEGVLIKEGEARISDMAYMMRANFNVGSRSFYYETTLLKDWMRRNFRDMEP